MNDSIKKKAVLGGCVFMCSAVSVLCFHFCFFSQVNAIYIHSSYLYSARTLFFHNEGAGACIGHIGDLMREQIKMSYAKVVQNSLFFFLFN